LRAGASDHSLTLLARSVLKLVSKSRDHVAAVKKVALRCNACLLAAFRGEDWASWGYRLLELVEMPDENPRAGR
jgi:hypothetical protein